LLFKVRVIDSEGEPVAGVRIGSINHYSISDLIDLAQSANASTRIQYQLPKVSHVSLNIYDYYGRLVAVLVNGVQDAGSYTVIWSGADPIGNPVLSGYYISRLIATPVDGIGDPVTEERPMVLELAPDPAATIIGYTDDSGEYITNDTLYFPGLLGNPPEVEVLDEYGIPVGLFHYTDTVTVTMSIPDDPETFLSFDRKLSTSGNSFQLVWELK